ncbi:MAG: hypothetical protein ACI8QZ_002518 [Chlamydiales bacterium]|jgi:hypothetical protein
MSERDSNLTDRPEGDGEQPADWLGAWVVPEARAEFRAELQQAFVQGNLAASDDDAHVEALEREVGPYLDQIPAPPARGEFFQQLRSEFVAGRSAVRAPRRSARPQRSQRVPRRARSLSMRWRLLAGGVLAAAAAVLVLMRPTPIEPVTEPVTALVQVASVLAWEAVPGVDLVASGLTVDGESLAGLDPQQAEDRLSSAQVIATGDDPAQFVIGEYFVVELAANSRVELLQINRLGGDDLTGEEPAGADPRHFFLRGDKGALRVATGPAFPGSRMTVAAPFMEVDVVGTVFGLDVFDGEATCLCCSEGTVEARPMVDPVEESQSIPAGTSELAGPGFAKKKPIEDTHLPPLEALALFWD